MTCATCKHVTTEGVPTPHGFCRRYPPTALSQVTSQFPLVDIEKFICGEFAVKKSAKPAPSKPAIKERK